MIYIDEEYNFGFGFNDNNEKVLVVYNNKLQHVSTLIGEAAVVVYELLTQKDYIDKNRKVEK